MANSTCGAASLTSTTVISPAGAEDCGQKSGNTCTSVTGSYRTATSWKGANLPVSVNCCSTASAHAMSHRVA